MKAQFLRQSLHDRFLHDWVLNERRATMHGRNQGLRRVDASFDCGSQARLLDIGGGDGLLSHRHARNPASECKTGLLQVCFTSDLFYGSPIVEENQAV